MARKQLGENKKKLYIYIYIYIYKIKYATWNVREIATKIGTG